VRRNGAHNARAVNRLIDRRAAFSVRSPPRDISLRAVRIQPPERVFDFSDPNQGRVRFETSLLIVFVVVLEAHAIEKIPIVAVALSLKLSSSPSPEENELSTICQIIVQKVR